LLATRKDIFDEYAQPQFESAIPRALPHPGSPADPGSRRSLYLMQKGSEK